MGNLPSDQECLHRFVTCGDERAFAAVVERHLRLVHGAAMRVLGDSEAAQEIAQCVFILLAKHAWRLTSHPAFTGWLYRTAVLEAQEYRRGQARRLKRERMAVALGLTTNHEEPSISALAPELDEAMLELRSGDREALVLRYFSGKSVREVGEALGIREDAAQKRLSKALDALTRCFRRRGMRVAAPAITAGVLQNAAISTAAIPTGMGGVIAQAAVTAVPAFSFSAAAVSAAKIMSLTKTQITLACMTLALVPIGYEWHVVAAAKSDNARLGAQLHDLRVAAIAAEKRRMETERQIGSIGREIAKSAPKPQGVEVPATLAPATWDDRSPYVRLPRELLSKVRFTDFGSAPAADGKMDRFALPVLGADGQPSPALEAALGLSTVETQQFRQVCRSAFAEFNARMAQHTITTRPQMPNHEAVRIDVSAFPDEGAAFQQRLRNQLTGILGAERTEAFWQQAAPTFSDDFNDFGEIGRAHV